MSERFSPEQLDAIGATAKAEADVLRVAKYPELTALGVGIGMLVSVAAQAAADARTLAALREWLTAEADGVRHELKTVTGFVAVDLYSDLRRLNAVLAELDRRMARPDGAEEQS